MKGFEGFLKKCRESLNLDREGLIAMVSDLKEGFKGFSRWGFLKRLVGF